MKNNLNIRRPAGVGVDEASNIERSREPTGLEHSTTLRENFCLLPNKELAKKIKEIVEA